MKSIVKTIFFVYALILLWLVLFKLSFNVTSVLAEYHTRSLNLIPFTGHVGEIAENLIVFIPFGLLLGAAFKKVGLWQKVIFILIFSVAIETIQYVLAIGVSDITDVITNTLGGLVGLYTYTTIKNHVDSEKMDRFMIVFIGLLIILFLLLRLFVFRVRY